MILHEAPTIFFELVRATANHKKIPELYIEKDYWITRGLNHLSRSEYKESVVFKGGTSLSKVYGIVERFSEDIDLALKCGPKIGDAKRKNLMRAVEKTVSDDLRNLPGHTLESKHGLFRKTVYEFPKQSELVHASHVTNEILVEINSFADPEPAAKLPIGSLIGEFLEMSARLDLVEQFELDKFEILVLGVERTLCEKIMSLVRAEHEGHSGEGYRRRIRHFYDIVHILRQQEYRNFVHTNSFRKLLKKVKCSDRESFPKEAPRWLDPPMSDAKVFSSDMSFWNEIEREFQGGLRDMLYRNELLDISEVRESFSLIRDSLS